MSTRNETFKSVNYAYNANKEKIQKLAEDIKIILLLDDATFFSAEKEETSLTSLTASKLYKSL